MKKVLFVVLALTIVVNSLPAPMVFAASKDECAIWLCLPAGFPGGCGGAKKAFKKRLKKGKSPLPSLHSCWSGDDDKGDMSYRYRYAAFVPTRRVCQEWSSDDEYATCQKWVTIPAHYVKNQRCVQDYEDGTSYPDGCTQTKRYVDIYVDGKIVGDTYYW